MHFTLMLSRDTYLRRVLLCDSCVGATTVQSFPANIFIEFISRMIINCAEKYAVARLDRSHTHVRPQRINEQLHVEKATNFAQFYRKND